MHIYVCIYLRYYLYQEQTIQSFSLFPPESGDVKMTPAFLISIKSILKYKRTF